MAGDAIVPSDESGFSGITIASNGRDEAEVNDIMRTVERLEATIIRPAQKVLWGGCSGYITDLDGHLWEVVHNPFWTIDENGNVRFP